MNQKDLFLIRGIPGSGKSTFVHSIARPGDASVAPDDFLLNDQGEYEWSPERLQRAIQKCTETVKEAMSASIPRIFVHSVFNKAEHMKIYLDLSEKYGYRSFSLILETRHNGTSIHPLTKEVMEDFKDTFDIKL